MSGVMSAKKQQLVYLSDDDMAASNIKVGWKTNICPMKVLVGVFDRPELFYSMLAQASASPLKSHVYCSLHFNTSCLMLDGKSKVAEFL